MAQKDAPLFTEQIHADDPVRSFLSRWTALELRDRDATFVVGVKTTGIYCRVGCPAKLPRPENVRFFDTAADAEQFGFRACKRCQPDAEAPDAEQRELIERACRQIEEAPGARSTAAIAAGLGLSLSHFQRVFKQITGVTPHEYTEAVRSRRLRDSLHSGGSITTSLHQAGYGSSSRLYERKNAILGMRPGQAKRGGSGVTIRMTTATCSLGRVLVAVSDQGICAITLGDSEDEMEREFRSRFPQATHSEGDEAFQALVRRVVDLVDQPRVGQDLPLDIRGTAFQQRVWQALRQIPAGETRTYQQLAAAIGQPTAARAVGTACGANAIAVAIPCHRAIGSDGKLTGYRWGTDRKAELLRREQLG